MSKEDKEQARDHHRTGPPPVVPEPSGRLRRATRSEPATEEEVAVLVNAVDPGLRILVVHILECGLRPDVAAAPRWCPSDPT